MPRPSRDPNQLAREIDAAVSIREQKEWHRLREGLIFQWYEVFLLAGLFGFGIGVVVTVIFGLPQDNLALYYFMVLWTLGFILMTILCIEFLIRRFRILRRVYELQQRRLDRLERELGKKKKKTGNPEEAEEH